MSGEPAVGDNPNFALLERQEDIPSSESFLNSARQKFGYVDIRPNAHTFWWLFYSTHSAGYENRPLVMWLQGGPGLGGSGLGVFEIIGPFDVNGNPRDFTWVQEVNLLVVDNPVGAGFSYVDTHEAYPTDVHQIADDLAQFIKEFMRQNPEFKTVPFYIMGQSYGGKMTAAATQKFHQEILAGDLECNLTGMAMGNAWIHPADITLSYGPMLYWMSNVDEAGLERIQASAKLCQEAVDAGEWLTATQQWRNTAQVIWDESNQVNFYNILEHEPSYGSSKRAARYVWNDQTIYVGEENSPDLEDFMNTQVKEHLGIIPEGVWWGAQKSVVRNKQDVDLMKDVVGIVDDILKTTDIHVVVYEGQLDIICNTVGAMNWVQRLTWDGLNEYNGAEKKALIDPETKLTDTFVKAHDNFKFYWVLGAGHTAAADAKFAGLRMLKRIIDDVDR